MNKKRTAVVIYVWSLLAGACLLAFFWSPVTFVPMFTEEWRVIDHTWGFNNAFITLSVKNIGSSSLSVASVQVNDATVAESNVAYGGSFTGTAHTLDPGESGTIIITHTFISGIEYEFAWISARGNKFWHVATAP